MLEMCAHHNFDSVRQLAVGISEHAARVARNAVAKHQGDVAWQYHILIGFGDEGRNSGKCTSVVVFVEAIVELTPFFSG